MSRARTSRKESAVLLVSCPDRQGLIASMTAFLHEHGGNIIRLDQHVEAAGPETGSPVFLMRVEWSLEGFALSAAALEVEVAKLARRHEMRWTLHTEQRPQRAALFVSKISHCLYDVLARAQAGEWHIEIPLIISNHADLGVAAERFGVPFHHIPVTKATKADAEAEQLRLLAAADVDFIVLARYMQILSDDFVSHYPEKIINIHHSFLPAFIGARPYHQAHARGVKIIGATSHYVTADLDEGPIIAQDVVHVGHQDVVRDLVRKGRDLEKTVLARAIWHHLRRDILVVGRRTVVF